MRVPGTLIKFEYLDNFIYDKHSSFNLVKLKISFEFQVDRVKLTSFVKGEKRNGVSS